MRIWSLHPKYLDTKGLVALWRETLLAKHVLEGRTKGYTNHPQLIRFKAVENPQEAINQYLAEIVVEAEKRGYNFDKTKINWNFTPIQIPVTSGQMEFEREHLARKLSVRDEEKLRTLPEGKLLETVSIFYVVEGEIESWEII
jgi:hypothetical protein